ncbi:MAG: hypothetical protein HXO72_04700 [Scardovia wiggsiae]|uniref:hypothetical protein n=1 Tax=Scardovia wiggsiae TaxID=230143 RepID=UPI001CB62B1C|nr:hypothetical protein [Scardovia wiggsiae]
MTRKKLTGIIIVIVVLLAIGGIWAYVKYLKPAPTPLATPTVKTTPTFKKHATKPSPTTQPVSEQRIRQQALTVEKNLRHWGSNIMFTGDREENQWKNLTAKQAIDLFHNNKNFEQDGRTTFTQLTGKDALNITGKSGQTLYPGYGDNVHPVDDSGEYVRWLWTSYQDYWQSQYFALGVNLMDAHVENITHTNGRWVARVKWKQQAHIYSPPKQFTRPQNEFTFMPSVGTYEGVDEITWDSQGENGRISTMSGSSNWFLTPYVSGWKSRDTTFPQLIGAKRCDPWLDFKGSDFYSWNYENTEKLDPGFINFATSYDPPDNWG